MMKPVVLTHKIQLLVNSPDPEKRKEVLNKLYQWQQLCFRSANMVLAHRFAQDNLKQFFYLTEDIQCKLADRAKDEQGILTTSKVNTTYQLLSRWFKGDLPSDIFTNLNRALHKDYDSKREALWKGEITMSGCKRDLPIPFKSRSIKDLQLLPNKRDYSFTLFKQPLRTFLGKDRFFKKDLLDRIVDGCLQLCDSWLKLEKGKIYLLLTTKRLVTPTAPDINTIAEAHLTIDTPIVVTVAGKVTAHIGSKEEFLYRRLAIQAALKRCQQGAAGNRGGHGRKRRLKSVTRYKEIEKNYIDHKCHVYSKKLIDLCLKWGAGMLVLCGQREKEELSEEDPFLLRNWSLFGLKEKILYKAARAGIQVIIE